MYINRDVHIQVDALPSFLMILSVSIALLRVVIIVLRDKLHCTYGKYGLNYFC